jgi:hypothetical protein
LLLLGTPPSDEAINVVSNAYRTSAYHYDAYLGIGRLPLIGETPKAKFWLTADLRGWPRPCGRMARLVIPREVAGSTPANGVAAGLDCATARAMTGLHDLLHTNAAAAPQVGEEPKS